MNNIRLAIVGSRTFNDYNMVVKVLSQLKHDYDYNYIEIVSGGAKGADAFGERYANENGIKLTVFPTDWKKWGKRAGFIRNVDIIKNCDVCVCFWDGESHGTKHDVELCQQMHKPCHIWNFIKNELTFIENE
mgnify:CR=1 FL=1